jgi:peptidoglycan/LPS O-acetylase OafA/YrhL
LDNIRSLTVALVVVYHVFYSFNTVGITTNLGVRGLGIPQAEVVCYALYPWFMVLMFLVAGISARYALAVRGPAAFRKERARKLLLPLVGGVFLLGWINGYATAHSPGAEGLTEMAAAVPGPVRYVIYALTGLGPLWFLIELFAGSLILLLLRALDRGDRLWALCGRAFSGRRGVALAALLVFVAWGAAQVLNTPYLTFFRNGIYWVVFLLGHYVFSHEELLAGLRDKRVALALLAVSVASGALFVRAYYGTDYTAPACLQSFLTTFFAWFTCLAFLACGQRWLNGAGRFARFAHRDSFGMYVFHYPLLTAIAYLLVTRAPQLQAPALYVVLVVAIFPVTVGFTELVKRIPVLRTLLLGL